jgi:hypothetical protein
MLDVSVMLVAIARRHEHLYVAAHDFARGIAKQLFAGGVVDLHDRVSVNHDDAIDGSRDQRREQGVLFLGFGGHSG